MFGEMLPAIDSLWQRHDAKIVKRSSFGWRLNVRASTRSRHPGELRPRPVAQPRISGFRRSLSCRRLLQIATFLPRGLEHPIWQMAGASATETDGDEKRQGCGGGPPHPRVN